MADDDSTVLVVGRVNLIALEFDIAGEKTYLSSHLNGIRSECLHTSVVFGEERPIESDLGSFVNVCDGLDSALLCIATQVSCGSNDNLFSDLPVKRFAILHVHESDFGSTLGSSRLEIGPGDWPVDTVHLKSTIIDTDDFVSEDRNLRIILCAPKGDSDL